MAILTKTKIQNFWKIGDREWLWPTTYLAPCFGKGEVMVKSVKLTKCVQVPDLYRVIWGTRYERAFR